jgi:CDP-6-deoxy-D-xylo-4-hexulose-3-dehydrase
MKFFHPLMKNNIIKNDIDKVITFLKKNSVLTQSKNVEKFEKNWSKWLGVKYSVFLNSGSSANFLSMSLLRQLNKDKKKNEIIVPPLTWVSDINSIIFNGFKPVFCDINLENLSISESELSKKINIKTAAVFITHAQGFNGLTEKIVKLLKEKKIPLIEDVCESHGAKYKNKKLGSIGLISNFSFYYAHHLSTIEGGMLCTNNRNIYEMALMMRGHGMLREIKRKNQIIKISKKYPDLNKNFIFLYPGFNFRNNEIGAVIGLNQLKRLDKNNLKRTKNFKLFLSLLDKNKFITKFNLQGSSNYAFPLILRIGNFKSRDQLEKLMNLNNIEFRRGNAGGGNQLRQPYLKKYFQNKKKYLNFKNTDYVHHYGYYIGNYPDLKKNNILNLCKILNSLQSE